MLYFNGSSKSYNFLRSDLTEFNKLVEFERAPDLDYSIVSTEPIPNFLSYIKDKFPLNLLSKISGCSTPSHLSIKT